MPLDPHAFRKVGRYLVRRIVGEGPLSWTFEAEDTALFGARRAVRVCKPGMVDAKSFEHQARLLAAIRHPNLVSLQGYGHDEATDCHFLVMDWIEGGSLTEVRPTWQVEREPLRVGGLVLSVAQIARCFEDVLSALAALHDAGVVHRDVGPHTVLLSRDGVTVLTDLGIALRVAAASGDREGRAFGTPRYMAPEQAALEPLTPRADLFSVGLTLFRVLTGRSVYDDVSGTDTDLAISVHLSNLRARGGELALRFPDAIPGGLRRVIERAARIRPEDRFPDALAMRAALREALSGLAPRPEGRRLAAVVSADAADYSRRMAEDEEATVRAVSATRAHVEALAGEQGGRLVDFVGDNFLAEFPTTLGAVRFALAAQEGSPLVLRIGVVVGEIRAEGDRIFGGGINVAARLEALADPGGICISGVVREQLRGTLELEFDDLGEREVKNIPDPVRVFRIRRETSGLAPQVSDPRRRPPIAVLPFENLSGDPEQNYFADGLAEDLITRLSESGWGTPVIARNSSFVYKGRRVSIEQVGRELGASYVVEGSVRKAGDRVRVSAQLIDASSGHHVWAQHYDRRFEDALAIQDDITRAILRSMGVRFLAAEQERATRRDPTSVSAWDCSLRGLWHAGRATRQDSRLAREWFEKTLELDPKMTWARVNLAASHYADIGRQWTDSAERSLAALRRVARECVELDPDFGPSHTAMGIYHLAAGEPERAIASFQRGVELPPRMHSQRRWLAVGLTQVGRYADAIRELDVCFSIGPPDPSAEECFAMAFAHFGARRYEGAVSWCEKARQRQPVPDTFTDGVLAASLAHLGRLDEARSLLLGRRSSEERLRGFLASAAPEFVDRLVDGLRRAGWISPPLSP